MPSIHDLPQNEQDDLMSLDINPISPLKMKYINELRDRAKELLDAYPYPEHVTCDINLLRFVRGHEFNMDEAYDAFKKMLIWRKEKDVQKYFEKVKEVGFDVHKVPHADVFETCFHTNYSHKTDKEGHLIDIRLLGSIDVKALLAQPLEDWIDYNIYILEWRLYTLNKYSKETGHLQRLCCIQDMKGVGMHMVSPTLLTYLKDMTNMTSHNYPETMHRSFIVNVPGIFSSLWSLAKPVLHPRTVKKVVICTGDYLESLLTEIPIQNLPIYLGGFCKCADGCLSKLPNDEQFHISVSSKVHIPIELKKGQTLTWDWKLESGTIDVTNSFEKSELYKGSRVSCHQGSFTASADGVFEFYFDNSFSWVSGKVVIGTASIEN